MGRRAGYAIKEHGRFTFGYGHGTATSVPDEVAWGPSALLTKVFFLDDNRAKGLLDEVWCEGALGADFDGRQLVFFGGEDLAVNGGLRDAVLALVRESWPGWEVRWAHDGVVDVAEVLGLDRHVLEQPQNSLASDAAATSLAPAPWREQNLVTLCRADGVRHASLDLGLDDIEDLLAGGPAILEALDAQAADLCARELHVSAGAVIDPEARHIAYWYSVPQRDRGAALAARWPGWRIERTTGGFRDQLARAHVRGDGLWLTRDEVSPYAPPSDVADERQLSANRAEQLADGNVIALHPLVEKLLENLDDEAARRDNLLASWLASFPT